MSNLARPAPDVSQYVRGFGNGHSGIDYGNGGAAGDLDIYAAHSGVVLSVQMGYSNNGFYGSTDNQGWGNRIRIDHGNGIITAYSHLKPGSAKVSVGQRVARGQAIALMGNSGSSTGRHLHWELYLNGSRVDPEPYRSRDLPGLSADGGGGAPAALAPNQRRVTPGEPANRRIGSPSTSAPTGEMLNPGEVGDFKGFVRGESVSGNNIWFVGAYSGDYFWSGGFEGAANTAGLADLTPVAPVSLAPHQRRVTPGEPANRRIGSPSTSAPTGEMLNPGEVGDFKGFVRGESVSGNNIWFVGAYSGDYFWSGGFEGAANTAGLADLTTTPPVTPPTTPPVIVGATSRTPVYPKAIRGWSVPLGQGARDAGSKITHLIVHHTTNTGSDENYFKSDNDRSSCPTWYVLANGDTIEMIAPGKRPSATGKANTYSVAIETQNTSGAPAWGISEASHETIAQIAAWLFGFNGKTLDGVPVEFTLDRQHLIGHNEAGVNATACPGPSMRLDWIVARAKEIVAGTVVTPPVTPPTTPEPGDETIPVSKSWLQTLLDSLKKLLGQ